MLGHLGKVLKNQKALKEEQYWWSNRIDLQQKQQDEQIKAKIDHQDPVYIQAKNYELPSIILIASHSQKQFTRLISLSLEKTGILTIETLCRIPAPNLKNIRLLENHICKSAPLRKGFWPNLKWLVLNKNPINDLRCSLPMIKTEAQMQCLGVDTQNLSEGSLHKLEAKIIYTLKNLRYLKQRGGATLSKKYNFNLYYTQKLMIIGYSRMNTENQEDYQEDYD